MDRLMSLVQTEVRAPVGRYSAMLRIIPQLAAVLDRVSRQVAEPGLHRDSAQRDKATHHYRKYSADRRQSGWMLPEPAQIGRASCRESVSIAVDDVHGMKQD